jgi:F0F1-type ATP synthase assembly protein I
VSKRQRAFRRTATWVNLSIVGIQFPVAIAIGYFWGKWLDDHLGTFPWMTGVFALFGIAAGFVNLFRITAKAAREEEADFAQGPAADGSQERQDDRAGEP